MKIDLFDSSFVNEVISFNDFLKLANSIICRSPRLRKKIYGTEMNCHDLIHHCGEAWIECPLPIISPISIQSYRQDGECKIIAMATADSVTARLTSCNHDKVVLSRKKTIWPAIAEMLS